ncbi:phosphatidylinositol mannoside acyltransferase [Corynebacterium sp. ES2794-CONJ1]|uniref:phosphatidylinositol mannoside acyltransferase n=1 Tax=unclassified Corynebacterium TaxID=2624378 RepID=UPI00216AB21E|nr:MULTISPECIES: phosphatidylinositol mannoside acyltransferase [unclassified Corynebacterium]MCS4489217.1 phosphatidylinositol mannoside acyltransferase [Corynebacterium sp. ES2775-CONJ]MCS4491030.1 phosphatidylinositol mannoside acyltransferase [Corynebacterium sp. ES2715-CONJ3]MCS4531089.1 phosphatidylinositol mannoside acyltransferase [Corynebacterium sp. ES2730-CONJ]MCU9518456.1 phosphatidylinositol mannoside acyltransferase [Corynebacterium sp. ES2794-CONJ1]
MTPIKTKKFLSLASTYAYLAGWSVVKWLPLSIAAPLFMCFADRASKNGRGLEQLRRNLMRVVGPENTTRDLVKNSMRSYMRYWLEAFRLPLIAHDPSVIDAIEQNIQGKEHLLKSLSEERGTILVLTHSGNWDLAGLYLVHLAGGFSTVAERLKPEILYRAFLTFRESLGFTVYPHRDELGRSPMGQLTRDLESRTVVCLLGERDLGGRGLEVQFFGEETTMPTGAVKLALDTGADLLVVANWFEGNAAHPGWGIKISEPIAHTTLAEMLQAQAVIMEENIREHPADWHVLQPVWPTDRRGT